MTHFFPSVTRHLASLTSPYHVPEAHDKNTRHTNWADNIAYDKEKEEYDDEDEYAEVKTKRETEAYTLHAAEDSVTQHWNCALKDLKTKNYVPWLDYFFPPYPANTSGKFLPLHADSTVRREVVEEGIRTRLEECNVSAGCHILLDSTTMLMPPLLSSNGGRDDVATSVTEYLHNACLSGGGGNNGIKEGKESFQRNTMGIVEGVL